MAATITDDRQSFRDVIEERWDEIGNFKCRAHYVPAGDYLTVFFSDSFAIAERVDSILTVYRCKHTGDICGCKIKGDSLLAKHVMSEFQIEDSVDLQLLLYSASGTEPPKSRHYQLFQMLQKLPDHVSVPIKEILGTAA